MGHISDERIPNNVDLADDRRLQRALERWQPKFIQWWREMGPEGFNDVHEIYLRTAISADSKGWAHFDHVRMPDYRWGIFLATPDDDRKIGFGDDIGKPIWPEVPGEFRVPLRRLIVTQGDTEPASVEQQRLLGSTCPSLYDLRNLFQVNVEEGRHLWAMVYLLHSHFGRDGREEAEMLLERRSGDPDKPRILGAFNQPVKNWLDFFMFTMFTDRDGKYQLLALAESAFDPLSRTTRFMLTEEAHHMFVGETGVMRIVKRSAELTNEAKGNHDKVRLLGGIDLPTMQKYLNLWFSLSVDLFGGEKSSNAANYFAAGLKGRARESRYDDHVCLEDVYEMEWGEGVGDDGGPARMVSEEVPLRNAMNEVLRDEYVEDCARGVNRWNKSLAEAGVDFKLSLPHRRFNRHIGLYSAHEYDPAGAPMTNTEWQARNGAWLPSAHDEAFVDSLMTTAVYEPGKIAGWIAPPTKGIHGQPFEFEYVRTDG
jgi:benzoyl-CoA 2,3-dioxygenase component B